MELFESEVEESILEPAASSTSEVPAFPEIDIVNEECKEVCTSLTVVNMEEYCLAGGNADTESNHQEPESLKLVCKILYNTFKNIIIFIGKTLLRNLILRPIFLRKCST